MGLVAPRHVGSSQTRARTRVPCIGRQILNHCATREAPSFFWLVLARYIFLHPFIFNLYVSFYLKWVSCRQHTFISCLFIYCDNLCLLISAFRLLTFKGIIDMVGLISTLFVTVFSLLPMFFSTLFLPFVILIDHFIWFHFLSFLRISGISVILPFSFSFFFFLVVALEWEYTFTTNTSSL